MIDEVWDTRGQTMSYLLVDGRTGTPGLTRLSRSGVMSRWLLKLPCRSEPIQDYGSRQEACLSIRVVVIRVNQGKAISYYIVSR